MRIDRLRLHLVGAHQPRAQCPGAILRLDELAVEPDDIGDRPQKHERRRPAEQAHRKGVIALPIEAADAIDDGNADPGDPQARKLCEAHVQRFAPAGGAFPVDAGTGVAVHLVDQHRPGNHRHAAAHHIHQR